MRIQLPALVACALSMLLACGPDGDGAFAIDEVEYPEAVVSDGARGTLTIHWAGNPTFPVQASYRPTPNGCPDREGLTCWMPTQTFSERESPLIFVNGPHCLGVTEEVVFDFEIELIDANGVATNPYHAPFTCLPQ